MDKTQNDRDYLIDIYRIVAALGIVMIHVSSQAFSYIPKDDFGYVAGYSLDAVSRYGVPFFFMISGALFLDKNKQLSLKKLWTGNILRLLIVYMVWSVIYSIPTITSYNVSISNLFINPKFHLWFLPVMIGIYAIVPFLKTWVNNASRKEIELYLILFIVLNLVRTTIINLDISYSAGRILQLLDFGTIYIHLSYFILGYYLYTYGLPIRKVRYLVIMIIIPVLFNICWGISKSRQADRFVAGVFDSDSITTFIAIIAFWELIKIIYGKLTISDKAGRIITGISKDTFGVYLVHILVMELLMEKGISTLSLPQPVAIPVVFILIVLISFSIAAVLRRIPFIGKYIC